MIHRDIKPANIMINEDDEAILMDFGIVKLLQGDSHTTTGTIVGTLLYMSPDLIRGEPPDARSDIYSLGVALFEMLSGRVPFQADSAMTLMMMHQNDPVPDLHMLRQDTPEELIAIVQKSLAKTRPERYTTAGEMGAALSAVYNRLTQNDDKLTVQREAPLLASGSETLSDTPASTMPATGPASPAPYTAVVAEPTQTPLAATPAAKKSRSLTWIGVAALVLIVVLIAGGFGLRGMFAARRASKSLTAQEHGSHPGGEYPQLGGGDSPRRGSHCVRHACAPSFKYPAAYGSAADFLPEQRGRANHTSEHPLRPNFQYRYRLPGPLCGLV